MAQACSILVAARQALRAGTSLAYDPQPYVNNTSFRFRERTWFGRTKTYRSEVFRNGLNDAGHKDWSICNILRQQSLIIGIRLHLPIHLRIFWSVFSSWSGKTLGVRIAARFPIRWMGCRLRGESRSRNIQTEIVVGEQC